MIWTVATPGYSIAFSALLDLLDAHPVRADEAVRDETVTGLEHRRLVVDLPRWAVELDEVDDVDAEVLSRALEPHSEVVVGVVRDVERRPTAELRRDDEPLGPLAQEPADQPLASGRRRRRRRCRRT